MSEKYERNAFRRGFVAGFSSPYGVFTCGRRHDLPHDIDFVGRAWREVGSALGSALEEEGRKRDKATHPTQRAPSTARERCVS